jgi:hypothetical protein
MVDLPSIPLATPQVRAPQSPVSPGDIAQPYNDLARTLDKSGDFWGDGSEKLSLSVTQRNKGVTEGLRALERIGVEDRVATSALQSATGEYVKDLQKAPNNFVEGRHNDMEARAREIGDYKSLTQLQVAKTFVPLWSAIKALPPDQAGPVMADIARNVVPALPVRLPDRGVQAKIENEAVRLGVPPQLAVAVAAIESRGNANAVSPSGLHRGIFQLSDDEFVGGGGQGSPFDADQNIRPASRRCAPRARRLPRTLAARRRRPKST